MFEVLKRVDNQNISNMKQMETKTSFKMPKFLCPDPK